MALRHNSFFKLSKGERRATLWLVAIVAILIAARIGKQHLFQDSPRTTEPRHEDFQKELNAFGDSIQKQEPLPSETRQPPAQEPNPPKSLQLVPREE